PPRRWAGPPRRRWAGISRETNVDLPASNLHSSPAESGSLTSVPVPSPSPTPFSAVGRRSDVTAAGDLGDGAREVARQAGGEEQDHRGDLLRFTGTAQGDVGELRVDGVLRHGLRHRGVDEAGLDGIDADVLERDLLGHGLRHADDAGLRRRVVRLAEVADLAADRGHVDDRTAAVLLAHEAGGDLQHVPRRWTEMTSSNCCSVIFRMVASRVMPALLTQMSTPPKIREAASASFSTFSSEDTLHTMPAADSVPPSSSTAVAKLFSFISPR